MGLYKLEGNWNFCEILNQIKLIELYAMDTLNSIYYTVAKKAKNGQF
jgi:hypothetical protein